MVRARRAPRARAPRPRAAAGSPCAGACARACRRAVAPRASRRDLDHLDTPVFTASAHEGLINCIDGVGGVRGAGAPEVATGGRDGRACVWDLRVDGAAVAALEPTAGDVARDCWTVAFGDAHSADERALAAGYDNGDVKLLDLRAGKVRWETNVQNGVCGLQFDRPDIQANKLVVTTLESRYRVYDMRTHHPVLGYSMLSQVRAHGRRAAVDSRRRRARAALAGPRRGPPPASALTRPPPAAACRRLPRPRPQEAHESTVWSVAHLPQNRDVFMTCGGNGSLELWKYAYPAQRRVKDKVRRSRGDARRSAAARGEARRGARVLGSAGGLAERRAPRAERRAGCARGCTALTAACPPRVLRAAPLPAPSAVRSPPPLLPLAGRAREGRARPGEPAAEGDALDAAHLLLRLARGQGGPGGDGRARPDVPGGGSHKAGQGVTA